jgi:two-component sensor histidine kinase
MHFETRHRAKDGHEVWFEVSATCPDPESGEIYAFLHDVTERRNQAEAIAAALGEKQVLLRELYHRTKNNMHVVTGLLQLQADGLPGEPRLQEHFQVAINRIYSMALVHQKLYQSEDLSRIDLPEYIRDLAANLLEAEQPAAGPVHFELSAEQAMPEPIESAVPVGIILNELVTNSLKYAFAGRGGGTIRIKLHRDADGGTDIDYRDDGQGLDTQAAREGGLGISLIRNLSQQLLGTVEIGNAPDGGFRCRLRYPRH